MMNTTLKKLISATLCASVMLVSVPCAFAEETTATNKLPAIQAADADGVDSTDIKARTEAILHPKVKEELTTIPAGHAYIPKDTLLTVELTEEISSKTMKKGMPVPLILKDNLIVNDVVVVPAGTEVRGTVTQAKKNGMFGRSGKLEFAITSVEAVNGVKIPLQYVVKKEAGSDGGAVAVAAAVSLVGGLFMKGKNVTFKQGTLFDARVVADTDLGTTLEDLPEAMNPSKPHGTVIVIKK